MVPYKNQHCSRNQCGNSCFSSECSIEESSSTLNIRPTKTDHKRDRSLVGILITFNENHFVKSVGLLATSRSVALELNPSIKLSIW